MCRVFVYVCLCLVVSSSLQLHGLYPPDSSVYGIFHARILEWVAISYSRGSSKLKEWTHISCVSCIAGWFFTHWTTWEALMLRLNKFMAREFSRGKTTFQTSRWWAYPSPTPSASGHRFWDDYSTADEVSFPGSEIIESQRLKIKQQAQAIKKQPW